MRRELGLRVTGGVLAGTASALVLVIAGAATTSAATSGAASAQVPSACVVVNGPNGLSVQLGYAPNGPDECVTV